MLNVCLYKCTTSNICPDRTLLQETMEIKKRQDKEELNSSVLWSPLGKNLKNHKNILRQTLKSQVKKEFPFPCIPIFKYLQLSKRTIGIKKTYFNSYDTPYTSLYQKETSNKFCLRKYFNSYDTFILYYIKKEQAINFVSENILISMIPLYFIISKRNKQ